MLVATVLVGSGATGLDGELEIARFDIDSESVEDAAYVEQQFVTDSGAVSVVVIRGENVLSKEAMAGSLELHAEIRENETIAPTLAESRPTADTTTVFVESQLRSLGSFGELSLEDKSRTFGTFSAEELETALPETLADDRPVFGPGTSASTLLPADHDGTAEADARLLLVRHDESTDEELREAQRALETLVDTHLDEESFVFGEALVEQRASDATGAAFAVLGPITFVLVVGLLGLAYRDPLDALLAVVGIGIVLLWTAGFVGWTGLTQTQLLVAVPWLLLGLAIDYGLHVVMRYREALEAGSKPSARAMTVGLSGVLVALGVTTVTTAVGFLSGVFGPVPVRDFGVVTAFGIVSALLVFGAFVPALRVELDGVVRGRRTRAPVGRVRTVHRIVRLGVVGATRAPATVVVVALVLTAGGLAGATQVDTSVDRTDFYPTEPPEWLSSVPGVGTDESQTLRAQATFLDERFEMASGDEHVDVLIRGAVANESGANAIATVERETRSAETVRQSGSSAGVYTPLNVSERFAAFDSRIADAIESADTTGDGRPDGNLTGVFDATYEIAEPEMDVVVHRDGPGEYRAVRVVVPVDSGADAATVASELRSIAELADADPAVTVTVTGEPIVTADRQSALLGVLVRSFLITLTVTVALLAVLFWLRYRDLLLGLMTVVPVLFALSWVLGTMQLAGIPYNVETAIITGIAIGLGVDYAIHISVRFRQAYGRTDHPACEQERLAEALSSAVEETGGTLFASAATTAAAVGVLLVTFVPSLQRFGLVMLLTVLYAFVASVFVLPSLLALRFGSRGGRQ